MNPPRNIYLLVLPRVHLLDLAAPGQVFAHDVFADELNVHYISPQTALSSHQGLHLNQLEPLPEQVDKDDWLMLIGSKHLHAHLHEPAYQQAVHWLRDRHSQFGLVAGICSGSLLAAQAGLLKHKHCTTHHDLIGHLRQLEPQAGKRSRHKQRVSRQPAVKWKLKRNRFPRQSLLANLPHHCQTTHTQLLSCAG